MSYLAQKIGQVRQRRAAPPALVESIPAPVLGWNARDPLSDMDPRFALVLDNYFPDGSQIRLRQGNTQHLTGFPDLVETLHTAAFGGTRRLVAFSGGNSYDATAGGTVGTPLGTGFSNSRWIGANAGVNPGERAIYTNGVDDAQAWDGTGGGWGSAGLTGPSKPAGVTVSQKRLWVYDNGTGDAWYSPPEAVSGALSKFSIGSVAPDGGDLIAIGNLTLDGGNGPDDSTVFVMRDGSVVVYSGTDPSSAATWGLRGVWKTGRPIGDRCLVKYDKDLILITERGFESLLSYTTAGNVAGVPISDNIRTAVSDAHALYEGNFGWNGLFVPHSRQLIFNIPLIEGGSAEQYVQNAVDPRRPWCRYRDVSMICQAVIEDRRFIGVGQEVWEADVGGVDIDQPIFGSWQSAWIYFRPRGREKQFGQWRPHIRSDSKLTLATGVGVDFTDPRITEVSSSSGGAGGEWNVSLWNEDPWAGALLNQRPWLNAGNKGYNASFALQTRTSNLKVEILAADVSYQVGAIQ